MELKNTYKKLKEINDSIIAQMRSNVHVKSGHLKNSLREKTIDNTSTISFLEYGLQNRVWNDGENPVERIHTEKYANQLAPQVAKDIIQIIKKTIKK